LNLAPPQKSSKFVDESTTLPLHTSKMLDGLHKLLPLLLHTKKNRMTKKKRIGLFIPRPGRLWRFFPTSVQPFCHSWWEEVYMQLLAKDYLFINDAKVLDALAYSDLILSC
jgi:hypothetical protein